MQVKMARDFPGPYCSKHGISKRCLLSACQPSEATFLELTRLLKVPKGLVLELFKFKNSKHLSWSYIYGKPVNHTEIQTELRKMRELERKLSKNKQHDKLKDSGTSILISHPSLSTLPPLPLPTLPTHPETQMLTNSCKRKYKRSNQR